MLISFYRWRSYVSCVSLPKWSHTLCSYPKWNNWHRRWYIK